MSEPPQRPADSARSSAASRRARTPAWQTVVPTAFVLVVLAALVLLPFVNAAYVEPARLQIERFADPGRNEVTQIHVALAREVSFLDDYVDTGDPVLARRYREAALAEAAATRRLATLVGQLGDSVRGRFAEMRHLQITWHTAAEQALLPGARSRPQPDPLRSDDFEALLLGVARLDEAIGEETRHTRDHILDAVKAQRWTTALLAFAGLAGAGAVALLASRLRRYATELEGRRAELERAVEARARLMRGISHDVKNPMHAIDGHAALLGDGLLGPLSPDQAHSVARIRRGVRSVLALVDDLLSLSRAEAGQLEVRPQSIDLAVLLRETVEEHRAAARSAGHEVELSLPDGPAAAHTLHTDPERVRQVLGNLLTNAVKYTPSGGHIAVRAERRARSPGPNGAATPHHGAGARGRDGWVTIDVVDSGPGIPPDKLDAIFDEFARLPMHTGMPGSGLGLAISRRVARLLGGELTAATEPGGGGARFTLWLPGD